MKEHEQPCIPNETQQAINDIFFDLYGLPMAWAKVLSGWDSPLGKYWKDALESFNSLIQKPTEEGDIDVL